MQKKINKKMNKFMKKRLGLFMDAAQPEEDSDDKVIEYEL